MFMTCKPCLEKGQLADGHFTIEHTDNASLLMN